MCARDDCRIGRVLGLAGCGAVVHLVLRSRDGGGAGEETVEFVGAPGEEAVARGGLGVVGIVVVVEAEGVV